MFLFYDQSLSSSEKKQLIECLPVAPMIASHMIATGRLLMPPGKGEFFLKAKKDALYWERLSAIGETILEKKDWGPGRKEKWANGLNFYRELESGPSSILKDTLMAYLCLVMEQRQLGIATLRKLYAKHPLERQQKHSVVFMPNSLKNRLYSTLETVSARLLEMLPEREQLLFQLFWQRYFFNIQNKEFQQTIRDAFSVFELREYAFSYNWGVGLPELWVKQLHRLRTLQQSDAYLELSKRYLGKGPFFRKIWWAVAQWRQEGEWLGFLSDVWHGPRGGEQLHLILALEQSGLKKALALHSPVFQKPTFQTQRKQLRAYKKHPVLWPYAWVRLFDLGDYSSDDLSVFAIP